MARLYVPLDVEFATNDRILAAGPLASYLYVCSLAHAKRQGDRDGREGFVNAGALRVLTIGFPGKPEKYAQALVDAGLWREIDGGWTIPAWLKHNKSAEQISADKQALKDKSLLGNHRRHHEAKGEKNPDCPLCYPPDSSPRGENPLPPGTKNAPKVKGEAEGREGKAEGEVKGEAEGRESSSGRPPKLESVPPLPADDDEARNAKKIETIIDAIIGARSVHRRVGDPIAHLKACRANFAKQERLGLDLMLASRPHFLADDADVHTVAAFYLASQYSKGGAA